MVKRKRTKNNKTMKKLFNFLWDFLKSQYKANPQILWIPIFLIVWILSIPILYWIDPTAAVFDAGIFQIPIYAAIIFYISLFISWQTLRMLYGSLYKYLKSGFKTDFDTLKPCTKIIISLSVFFLLLFCLVALMGVL